MGKNMGKPEEGDNGRGVGGGGRVKYASQKRTSDENVGKGGNICASGVKGKVRYTIVPKNEEGLENGNRRKSEA